MARDVQSFQVTVATDGGLGLPQSFNLTMPVRIVTHVTINVPPGPRGELAFALGAAGTQYFPSNAGGYLVADNTTFDWDLEDVIESGAWQLLATNTGLYSHTLQVVFLCQLPDAGPVSDQSPTTTTTASSSLLGLTVQ